MADGSNKLVVRTLANGATAQLRSIIDDADYDEARRIHAELTRIAAQLAQKHKFVRIREKRPKAVVVG